MVFTLWFLIASVDSVKGVDIGTAEDVAIVTDTDESSALLHATMAVNVDATYSDNTNSDDAIYKVDLGTAGDFKILTKTGVVTTGNTEVVGDIGTSPITFAALTGFSLIADSSGEFSTSTVVTGKVWAADYDVPTPSKMTTAILDMQTAYTDAAGRSNPDPDHLDLGAGYITDEILDHGLYKWGSNVNFKNTLTFDGTSKDVWILQIAGSLYVASDAKIKLKGGAKAENIFWQISGSTTIGTKAHVEGVFLCATAIVFEYGSSMNGAALSQTAVTLDAATIK